MEIIPIPNYPKYLPEVKSSPEYPRESLLNFLRNHETIPVTEKEAEICLSSQKATNLKNRVLSRGAYALAVAVPVILLLISLNIFGFSENDATAITGIIAAALTVALSNAWSMYATGSIPATESDKQNEEQNVLAEIQSRFDNLAEYLIILYAQEAHRDRIKTAAQEIDINHIKDQLYTVTTSQQKNKVDSAVKFLGVVITYILSGSTSENSRLESILVMHHLSISSERLISQV